MGSEPAPVNWNSVSEQHIAALNRFDIELDSLMYPKTKEMLMEATRRLLLVTFNYGSVEAQSRVDILDHQREIPTEYEIEHDQESLAESLKVGLFDKLPEEYVIVHGTDEFDKWIGPFISNVLQGHIEGSESYEHLTYCAEDGFCPTKIVRCFVRDRMAGEFDIADEAYIAYGDEMIHMNIQIVKELLARKVICLKEAEDMIEDYQNCLESITEFEIQYDAARFDNLSLE